MDPRDATDWMNFWRIGDLFTMAGKKGMQVHKRPICSSIVLYEVSHWFIGEAEAARLVYPGSKVRT